MWTETLENFGRWMRRNVGSIIATILVAAFITLLVFAAINDSRNHTTSCTVLLSQQHTARDTINVYTFDKGCIGK